MLRSQQPKLLDHTRLLRTVFIVVSCIHIVGCYVFLFTHSHYRPKTSIYGSGKNRAAIVKIVGSHSPGRTAQGLKRTAATNTQKNGVAKHQKKAAEKKVKKASTAMVKKPKRSKKQVRPPVKKQKKKQVKTVQKNAQEVAHKVEPKKNPEKITEQHKEELKKESPVTNQASAQAIATPNDVDVVYATPQEYHALMIEQALCQAMETVWAPPAGMDSDLAVDVAITIDWQGKIIETAIEKRSGVLIFDVAVEQAVAAFCPPREAWGKTVHLVFKP